MQKYLKRVTYHHGQFVNNVYILDFPCYMRKVAKENKDAHDERKKNIQQEFRSKMNLLVDISKQAAGSTNNGNTALKLFSNTTLSSQLTGIEERLIKEFGVILRVLNSGYTINIERFEEYCKSTAELYVSLYNWYYMPPSVHKIFIHGAIIIKAALLPIGELSEEAQESKNKDLRKYRDSYTQKISRIKINEDLFNRLLLSSDPLLTSSYLRKKIHKKIDRSLLPLLIPTYKEKRELIEDESDNDADLLLSSSSEACDDSD